MSEGSENLKHRKMVSFKKLNKSTRDQQDEYIQKLLSHNQKKAESDDDDDDESDLEGLPFGGRVYLPRRYKPDTWACIGLQISLVFGVIALAYYAYYYYEHMHVNVIKAYAHMGFDTAQHELGNRYLHGKNKLYYYF